MHPEIHIDPEYLVTDSGTSDGTQIKYFLNNKWYKIDRYGGEGACEELVSRILKLCNYPDDKYVHYKQVTINGSAGCVSDNFLSDDERFITLYRLHINTIGTDPAIITSKMDHDDAINYMIDFVLNQTGLDISEYLADTFLLDSLILNEDRHFNNLGLIFDGIGYRTAPIFDNGKSLFIGNTRYDPKKPMMDNRKNSFAKAFSGSFALNRDYLSEYASFSLDIKKIEKYLQTKTLSADTIYSRLAKLCKIYTI